MMTAEPSTPPNSSVSVKSTEPTGIKQFTRLPAFNEPLWGIEDKRYNVLYGGAGSGKTHAIVQYLTYLFLTVEDCEFAVVRKSNPSLKRSVYMGSPSIIRQLAEWDIPNEWHNRTNQIVRNPIKNNTLYFISIDDSEKIKSMNLNYIWMEEATEFSVTDFMQLNARLRGPNKNGINRMWLSFNPVSLYNWVYQWFIVNPTPETIKNTNLHRSVPFDNPLLPDDYISALIQMSEGDDNFFRVYIEGEPGVPSGLVYKNFRFSDPSDWPSEVWHQTPFYGVDFGYNDPMTLVEVRRYDKQYYVRERYYKTHQQIEDLITFMKEEPIDSKSLIFCDSASPERIHKIQSAGFSALKSNKDIFAGINEVNSSTVYISHDSENLRAEAMSYQWKPRSSQDVKDTLKDEPIDANNHICFARGTMVSTNDGEIPIEEIHIGDKVLTSKGYREVIDCGMTGISDTKTYCFSNGTSIRCTPDHPFFVHGKGFIPIDSIRYDDYLCGLNIQRTMDNNGTDTPIQTYVPTGCISEGERDTFIGRFGRTIADISQRVCTSITSTRIQGITDYRTSNVCTVPNTWRSIQKHGLKPTRKPLMNTLIPSDILRKNGTLHPKEGNSTGYKLKNPMRNENTSIRSVRYVVAHSRHGIGGNRFDSVPTVAVPQGGERTGRTWMKERVSSVIKHSKSIDTKIPDVVPVHVVRSYGGKNEEVYNLTVDVEHEFFANGILVSNCDALRYAIFSMSMMGRSGVAGVLGKDSNEGPFKKEQKYIPKNW